MIVMMITSQQEDLNYPFSPISPLKEGKKKPPRKSKTKILPKYLTLTEFLAKKEAERFNLFLIDVNNLMYSLRQITTENNLRADPFQRLQSFFETHQPYRAILCASIHLSKYQSHFPNNPNIQWYFQTMKKGSKDADVDTLLTGESIEYILLNAKQIKKIYLGAGDKDLIIILEKAAKFNIECELLGIKPEFTAQELKGMVKKCNYLY